MTIQDIFANCYLLNLQMYIRIVFNSPTIYFREYFKYIFDYLSHIITINIFSLYLNFLVKENIIANMYNNIVIIKYIF